MATASVGRGTALGLGEETTYGTAVARTNWLRVLSASVRRERPKVIRPHLGVNGAVSANPRDFVVPEDNVSGSVEILASYNDSTLMLLKHALGSVSTTGLGPYTHTFTLSSAPTGLTIEQIYGDSGQSEVFEGCKIDTWQLSIDRSGDGTMRLSCDVIGETSGGLVTAGTPTYSSGGEWIDAVDAGQFTFNAVNYDLRSLQISGRRNLARRPRLGSLNTLEPTPGDVYEVEVEFTVEYNTTLHAALLADTQGDATITFTGTGNNSLSITLHNMVINDVTIPLSDQGPIVQTVRARCLSDGTDEGVKLTFQNDNASATAN